MNSEEITSEIEENEDIDSNSDVIFAEQQTLKYDKETVEKIRKQIFTPLSQEATVSEKQECYSLLTNDNNTIPLMNLSELYLKAQDFSR